MVAEYFAGSCTQATSSGPARVATKTRLITPLMREDFEFMLRLSESGVRVGHIRGSFITGGKRQAASPRRPTPSRKSARFRNGPSMPTSSG